MDEQSLVSGSPPVRSSPASWQLVGLVLALCFLVGAVTWSVARPGRESFNEVDLGFLTDMTSHHNGAITLAFAYLDRDNDPLGAHFAREIVLTQTQEIAVMNALLTRAGGPPLDDTVAMSWMGMPTPAAEMPGLATATELDELRLAAGVQADEMFSRLMIRHHAAGAAMADLAESEGQNSDVKQLAHAIARVQRTEINEMANLRERLALAPVDTADLAVSHRVSRR